MTVAAVERCLSIVEELAGERNPVELTDLARRLSLPPSAVHRILVTLVERGWIVREEPSQKYALSLRMSTLAFRDLETRTVPDVVQSELNALAAETQEYCRLAILEGDNLVWVARAQGAPAGLRYDPDMGEEIVLHATANGKAWLATLPEADAIRIIRARGLRPTRALGPNSATTLDGFLAKLHEVRKAGYGTSIEEAEQGTAAVAVPFFSSADQGAPVAGTISVAGPLTRLGAARFDDLAVTLGEASARISAIWPLRNHMRDNPTTYEKQHAFVGYRSS